MLMRIMVSALLTCLSAFGGVTYTLTDLGFYEARGLSANGNVAGDSGGDGVLYSAGTTKDIGSLGSSSTYGWAVNDSGQAAGWSYNFFSRQQAFVYSNGAMTGLQSLGGLYSAAFSIDAAGDAVGWASTPGQYNLKHASMWKAGSTTATDLHTVIGATGAISEAAGINNNGWVTGQAVFDSGYRAFIWTGSSTQVLGTLPGDVFSFGTSINQSGQVAGYSTNSSYQDRAFVTNSQNQLISIGTLGGASSYALGINDLGSVVGDSNNSSNSQHGFLFSGGVLSDLNTLLANASGWTVTAAYSINDAGQIAGIATNASGAQRAVLLNPNGPTATPEPGTLLLLSAGLIGIALFKRRRANEAA